jgi:cell division protein ZapA
MGQVTVTVNDRTYTVGCDDGQEEHLGHLAEFVDKKVREAGSVGPAAESRLLLMAALMIADELSDMFEKNDSLQKQQTRQLADSPTADLVVSSLAQRLEAVADRLEST